MRVIRHSETRHAAAIARLTAKVYGRAEAYSAAQIRGQINNFPEGQFLAEYEGQVVGFCATLIVPEAAALTDHPWTAISGGGFGTRPSSEERRVGKEGVRTCRSRWSPEH